MKPAPALVLFDIDGTLLRRAGPHHKQALVDAIRDVTGIETSTDGIPVHGMLDPDIITRMLKRSGAAARRIRYAMPGVIARAQALYVRRVPDLQRKTCPGVRAALYRLKRRGVAIGLVTGNLTAIGWKKMERAGLKPYFRYGVFAEQAKDRTGLVRIAIAEASRRGWITKETPITLIGDAPTDVIAARSNGIRSIAVRTGISTREELDAEKPDVTLEDLRALKLEMLIPTRTATLPPARSAWHSAPDKWSPESSPR